MTEDGANRLRKVFGMLINAIMLTSLHGWRIVSCIGDKLESLIRQAQTNRKHRIVYDGITIA